MTTISTFMSSNLMILHAFALLLLVTADHTIVTLSHGGQLKGRRVELNGQVIDQFVGVRYAKPPVGERRFRKPEELDSWSEIVDATDSGDVCIQMDPFTMQTSGREDCLYLDINVPGGVTPFDNKAVMVWLPGGGYTSGTGSIYVGAPLALQGDVIVVSINYRLGVFGFLADENIGTGNYGLWDQRAAILWVKNNIAAFGGNPDLITIFGESAGGSSVVAQMLGAHNDGLFRRGIAQSGSLYVPWSWYLSLKQRVDIAADLKKQVGCERGTSVYECLRVEDPVRILNMTQKYSFPSFLFHPVPDEDFFPADIDDETYNLTSRFDLLVGYNDRESGFLSSFILLPYLSQFNESIQNGISTAAAHQYLLDTCRTSYTESAIELCAEYLSDLYGVKAAVDDRQRLLSIMEQMDHHLFKTDTTNLVQARMQLDVPTYAYEFVKFVNVPRDKQFAPLPEWVKPEADHGDDLFYVFGFDKFVNNVTEAVNYTLTQVGSDFAASYLGLLKEFATKNDSSFSERIQTFWTNFATSGNPNMPVRVDAPIWPPFTSENQLFMSLSDDMMPIEAPDLVIHNQIISLLYPSRRRKVAAEIPTQVLAQVTDEKMQPSLE